MWIDSEVHVLLVASILFDSKSFCSLFQSLHNLPEEGPKEISNLDSLSVIPGSSSLYLLPSAAEEADETGQATTYE